MVKIVLARTVNCKPISDLKGLFDLLYKAFKVRSLDSPLLHVTLAAESI